MPRKANKEEIDSIKSSLYYKIFNVIKLNNQSFYLDKDFNLIWDSEKEVVGIINNGENVFFADVDKIIKTISNESLAN